MILQFRVSESHTRRAPARRPVSRGSSAEIIIFPGVRIERETQGSSRPTARVAAGRLPIAKD